VAACETTMKNKTTLIGLAVIIALIGLAWWLSRSDSVPTVVDAVTPLPRSAEEAISIEDYIAGRVLGDAGRVSEFSASVEPKVPGFFAPFTISGEQLFPRVLHCQVTTVSRTVTPENPNPKFGKPQRSTIGEGLTAKTTSLFDLDQSIVGCLESQIDDRLLDEFFTQHALAPALSEFETRVERTPKGVNIRISGPGLGEEGISTTDPAFDAPDPYEAEQVVESLRRSRRDALAIKNFFEKLAEFTTPEERAKFFAGVKAANEDDAPGDSLQRQEKVIAFLRSRARIQLTEPAIVGEQKEFLLRQDAEQQKQLNRNSNEAT
jgi:hypothetical protein